MKNENLYYGKNNRVSFKVRKELIGILVGVLVLLAISIILRLPSAQDKLTTKYTDMGSTLTSDHVFVEVSYSELVTLIDSGELIFVFYSSPDCANCLSEIINVNTAATLWDVEVVYLFDATFALEEYEEGSDDEAEQDQLISKYEERLGVSLEFTPGLFAYDNSTLVFDSNDYLNDDETAMEITWSEIARDAFYRNLEENTDL